MHGAWSHAIQWYCIIEHSKRTPGFMRHAPFFIYKHIGQLWNHIVDQTDVDDFTCPEYITSLLIEPSSLNHWPLLAGSVARTHAKMYAQDADYAAHLLDKHGERDYAEGYVQIAL